MQKRILAIYMMLCMAFGTIGQNLFASAGGAVTTCDVSVSESAKQEDWGVKEFSEDEEKTDGKNLETTITTSDGSTYEVQVTYPEGCGIPADGTELLVSEIKPGEAGYHAYVDASMEQLDAKDDTILFAKVFDITIADAGNHSLVYEPDGTVFVSIRLIGKNLDTCTKVDVLHITEQKNRGTKSVKATSAMVPLQVDPINSSVKGENVEFTTDSFSVYVVIAHEGGDVVTPRVEFHFIEPGNGAPLHSGADVYYADAPYAFLNENNHEQTSQILKNGERLELISDPKNRDDEYFFGWYVVEPYVNGGTNAFGYNSSENKFCYAWPAGPSRISFDTPLSVSGNNTNVGSTIQWSLGDASGSGVVQSDGSVHVLLAPVFENYHFVNFMQFARDYAGESGGSKLMARKLFALGSAASVNVKISDLRANSTDSVRLIFKGWEYNAGTEQEPDWVRLDTVDYSGREIETTISVSRDIDLYPIFTEARWLDFNSGPVGGGANYIESRFLLAWEEGSANAGLSEIDGQSVLTKLEAPSRKGYVFAGWYADVTDYNAETGEFETGTLLTDTSISDGKVYIRGDVTLSGSENSEKAWEVADGKLKVYEDLSRLSLYARWIPDASTITIVYWTENADDSGYYSNAVRVLTTAEINEQLHTEYSSGSRITLEQFRQFTVPDADGRVGVLSADYLDDVGAVPAGEQIFYDLNVAASDASRVISGEGTTLFNVYFSRKVFTLVFHIGRDGYVSTSGEQTSANNGSWLQMFYNDADGDHATAYDEEEGIVPSGSRGTSKRADVTMTYSHDGITETYTSAYETNSDNIKNYYVPGADENVYVITAKYGAYIGDRWPSPSNPAFTFTTVGNSKEMYTWSAYYDSRFCKLSNDRKGSGQNWHPDINGAYSYMSAELCSNRDGTALINENQVHHLVAYFGDYNKNGVRKTYHILYESVDGTYDPDAVEIVSGNDYKGYAPTTWTVNVAHADRSVLDGRSFYEVSESVVISNLPPESQLASAIEGFELIYSCYVSHGTNDHHVYFFYCPRRYTITFKFENEADIREDKYYYTQSLAAAKKYDDPEKNGYRFVGWFTNEAGAGEPFDFANETMPAANLVLYPVMSVLQYMVKIDPNGAVIDHINYDVPDDDFYGLVANDYGVTGNGHNRSQATYFTADFGTPIGPYTLARNYILLTDREKDSASAAHYTGEKYYYVNMQFRAESDGDWGLSPDLRNAVYMTAEQIEKYYDYYKAVVSANEGYYTGVRLLSFTEFCEAYTSYDSNNPGEGAYRRVNGEHWTFMGWYQVFEDGTEASMPYNFNDPIYSEITLRAKWRLDGGIYVRYNPCFLAENGSGDIIAVLGEVDAWTDPAVPAMQLYADQSPICTLRAPTNITSTDEGEWVFRGWRVVKPEGESRSFVSGGNTYTYQKWVPIQLDDRNQPVYYGPGEDFIVNSELISQNDEYGAVIHMQAYYERADESLRRPDVTNLILDANDEHGGYVNTTDSGRLPELAGPGHQAVNTVTDLDSSHRPTRIEIGDLQSNLALHLYRYATSKTYGSVEGIKLFSHDDGYFLLGFDENDDPDSPTTGMPYIPAFAPDSVAAVTRDENRTLYAMWEPMVYVTFVNTTGADLSIELGGTGTHTVSIVNEVTGEFDRNAGTTHIFLPAKSADGNGCVKIVLPGAVPGADSFTATTVNGHVNYKLFVSACLGTASTAYGSGSEEVRYGGTAAFSGILQKDPVGIVVTYTEQEDPSVVFDVNGGEWKETDPAFMHSASNENIYTIFQADVELRGKNYEPSRPLYAGKEFLGWTTNADIASHTDFSSEASVTWGDTTIIPDSGSNVLDKVRSDFLWNFNEEPPYGVTLYAVWCDTVKVTFDLIKNGNNYHTWTGPETAEEPGTGVFYRNPSNQRYVTCTVLKGEKVPRPNNPTNANWDFLRWVTQSGYENRTTNLSVITGGGIVFEFDQRITYNRTLFTSWMSQNDIRRYTFTVKNVIEGGPSGEEFEYVISAASNMNYSGSYYPSDPAFLPVTVRLRNNETYTVEITAVRYNSGWSRNSLYLTVFDRNGKHVCEGHLLGYLNNSTLEYESSDYQIALTITQVPKEGYTTAVSAPDGTTVDLGERSYAFNYGRGNNMTGTKTVTTPADSFTFRSAHVSSGNSNAYVGENQNDGMNSQTYLDVEETIVFTNTSLVTVYPAPTGYHESSLPFLILLLAGALLLGGLGICPKRRKV